MEPVITGVIGLLFGSVIAWLALRSRTAGLSARLSLTEKELAAEKADLARLQQAHTDLVAGRPGWNPRWRLNERPATKRSS